MQPGRPAKALNIEPGATYVFDLAYYDYGWRAKPDALGCRFVTQLQRLQLFAG